MENQNDLLKPLKIGEIAEGKVTGRSRSAIYVDLGPQGTGIIYGKEFYEVKDVLQGLKIGDRIFAKVVDLETEEGYIELSLSKADKEIAWAELLKKKEADENLEVKISGANKGGLLAEVKGISAFLPVSQLSPEHYPRVGGGDTNKILKELQKFTGQTLTVKIFSVDPKEEKLILSERAKDASRIKEILENYKVGDVVEGEITGVADFGAFIKFPASAEASADESKKVLEGLIHISELDWQLVEDPAEVVKVGQKVRAKIIDISNDRVFLSLKALKKDPWKDIEKKFKKGDIVEGQVAKFNPFGAFIKLTDKIQGLCHISEFGTKTKMEKALEIGKKYKFEILQIDPENHRLALTLSKK